MPNVIVLDNGGGLIKAGFAGERDPTIVVPNCSARPSSSASKKPLIADQLLSPDVDLTSASLRRPIDRGYLVNADLQRDIWQHLLRSCLHVDPTRTPLSLLLVDPLFNPLSSQSSADEIIFEDLSFKSLFVADSPSLVHLYEAGTRSGGNAQCSLVVDCGFSFAHAAPVLQNFTLNYGVKRLDLGGKALTNYLKELVSYRSVNVMDETLLIDHVKENLCFVSLDVPRDLRLARNSGRDNPFRCTYVLPDGITHTKGYVKDIDEANRYRSLPYGSRNGITPGSQQEAERPEERKRADMNKNEFNLTNERFLVPEMIFRPADLGMNQAGLAECIVRAVHSCHPHLHPALFESIVLTGGSTLFPGFAERLEMELRPLVSDEYKVKITTQEDPIKGVWRGGSLLASSPEFESMCVTKAEYEEMGSFRCRRRFFH